MVVVFVAVVVVIVVVFVAVAFTIVVFAVAIAVVVVIVVDIVVLTNFLLECTIRTWRLGQLGTNSSFLWLPGLVLQSKYDQNSTWGTLRLQNHLLQLGFLFTFLWSRDNSI